MAKPIRIGFDKIHLADGSWAHGLDLVRETVSLGSSFVFPTGSECESLSSEEYDNIFMRQSSSLYERSIVEKYILGHVDEHPLRDEDAILSLSILSMFFWGDDPGRRFSTS